jgi:hypothetical protein
MAKFMGYEVGDNEETEGKKDGVLAMVENKRNTEQRIMHLLKAADRSMFEIILCLGNVTYDDANRAIRYLLDSRQAYYDQITDKYGLA